MRKMPFKSDTCGKELQNRDRAARTYHGPLTSSLGNFSLQPGHSQLLPGETKEHDYLAVLLRAEGTGMARKHSCEVSGGTPSLV